MAKIRVYRNRQPGKIMFRSWEFDPRLNLLKKSPETGTSLQRSSSVATVQNEELMQEEQNMAKYTPHPIRVNYRRLSDGRFEPSIS